MMAVMLKQMQGPNLSIQAEELLPQAWLELARVSWMLRSKGRSKYNNLFHYSTSIERDAQLLANRIALLKQEEMKTWKKIEETKKRAKEVNDLKRRNEERIQ